MPRAQELGIFSMASAMSLDVYIENLRVCLAPEDAAAIFPQQAATRPLLAEFAEFAELFFRGG